MGKNGSLYSLDYLDRLYTLRHCVSNLPTIEVTEDLNLEDNVYGTYLNRVRTDLMLILHRDSLEATESTIIPALEDYLKDLWSVIHGGMLCYTSIPKTEIASVLFRAACFVCFCKNYFLSEEEEPLSPLEVLMPGSALISHDLKYPNLKCMPVTWSENDESRLKTLLDQREALEANCLTQEETDELTFVKNEIKGLEYDLKYVIEAEMAGTNEFYPDAVTELQTLSSKLEGYRDRFELLELKAKNQALLNQLASLEAMKEDFLQSKNGCIEEGQWLLPANETLSNALCQSVLSRSDETATLLPVALLLSSEEKLSDPYNASRGFITEDEMQRLMDHSGDTIALIEAKKAVHRYYHDPHHLLGQLSLLCTALKQNDAHEGFGQQTHAGFGAYPAIITFASYYETLSEEEKSKIPEPVEREIDLLLSLSSDPNKNQNATANLQTCIGTRREQLEKLLMIYRTELSEISCNATEHARLIQGAEERLKQTMESFSTLLKKGTYVGRDKLGLTKKLMAFLNIKLNFTTLPEVEGLMTLTGQEMKEVVADKASIEAIAKHFNTIEELVIFIHTHPSRQLAAFFSVVGADLLPPLSRKMEDVAAILTSLTQEKFQVLYHALKQEATFDWEPGVLLQMFCDDLERTNFILELLGDEEQCLKAVKARDERHLTALHRAAEKNADVFFRLLALYPSVEARAAAINMKDDAGNSILHYAAVNAEVLITLLLRYYGEEAQITAALEERNQYRDTVFYCAATNPEILLWIFFRLGSAGILKLTSLKNYRDATALHIATRNVRALRILLANYPNDAARLNAIDTRTEFLESVLHSAANHRAESLDFLLQLYPTHRERFEALRKRDNRGRTVFHTAMKHESTLNVVFNYLNMQERALALQEKDGNALMVLDRALESPGLLTAAFSRITPEDCLRLIQVTDYRGQTLLHRVISDPELIETVLRFLPGEGLFNVVKMKTKHGDTFFHEAANRDAFAKVWVLLDKEEKLTILLEKNRFGDTVLHAICNNVDIVRLLSEDLLPAHWFRLLKIKNKAHITVMHKIVDDLETMLLCLKPLSGIERFKVLSQKNNADEIVLHSVRDSIVLQEMIQQLPHEYRLSVLNAKNHKGDTLLQCWAFINIEMQYRLLGLIPSHQRLQAMLEKNACNKSILGDVIFSWGIDAMEGLKRLLSLLPSKDRMRAIKVPIGQDCIWGKVDSCHETIPIILSQFDAIDRVTLVKETDPVGHRVLDNVLRSKSSNALSLVKNILDLIPPKDRLQAMLKKNTFGLDGFYYIEMPDILQCVMNALPLQHRLEAVRENEAGDRGVLYKLRNKGDMLQVLLETLSRSERLIALNDPDPLSYLHKPHSILETIAADLDVLIKVLGTLDHHESLDLNILKVVEKHLCGQRHHVFVRQFYLNCIESFKDPVPEDGQVPLMQGRFFVHATPSQIKNTAIHRVLTALREGTYAVLNEQHLAVIQQTPLLQKTISSYEQVSGLCVLTRRDARWAALA